MSISEDYQSAIDSSDSEEWLEKFGQKNKCQTRYYS